MKWCFGVKDILHKGVSRFQDVELLETLPFGKVLLLDGKLQSAEKDEYVYHECLVHVAMLTHPNPKTVFVMGGGEGATVREVLKHKTVERCVMVDIDDVVVDFCKKHLTDNQAAFNDPRLELIIDDAKTQLEKFDGTCDVIIGDLADPVAGGPCYQLYTQKFYEEVVKRKLNPGGVFVTQSGPAGVLSHDQVFSPIHNTISKVFAKCVPFSQHVPSFADTWGWNMGLMDANTKVPSADELDAAIAERIDGALRFMDGEAYTSITSLCKSIRETLRNETYVYSLENPRFIHGHGQETHSQYT